MPIDTMGGSRLVAATEIGSIIYQRSQVMCLNTLEEASVVAAEKCPEFPWWRIFKALEAAKLVAFLDEDRA